MTQETKQNIGEIVKFLVISFVIVLPIRYFIAQPFIVNGASMEPTFHNGDYLIIDELSYELRAPRKNEVAVFRYPGDPSKYFIKRIVGLPGETVVTDAGTTTLGGDEYFAEGDNRGASFDSRMWGPLNAKYLTGRVMFRLFPFTSIGYLPGYEN